MALSDFMPYGAPELLDAAPARMARSTLIANVAVSLMVASLGLFTARSVPPVRVIPDEIRVYEFFDTRAPHDLEPPPLEVEPAKPSKSFDEPSIVEPVPDRTVPPDDFANITPPDGRTGDGLVDSGVIPGTKPCVEPADDPLPNVFVYTDEMPVLVSAPEPRYPDLAREAGVEGVVTVQILVGLDGRVLRSIVAPRGSVLMLDEAALEASRRCVFTPALANGRPVKVWVSQQYRFRLH